MIQERVSSVLQEVRQGNCFGEQVTVVAAIKLQTTEAINAAIDAGITDVGDNHVQEFRANYSLLHPVRRHFIGHLQTNKVKYLVGKIALYHSLDRMELAEALSARSAREGVCSDVLVQVNIGCEESKGGFALDEAFDAYRKVTGFPALRVRGFMAMLPISEDEAYLASLVRQMRALYDRAKAENENIAYLSMGMSGDYKLCLANGSNMIRLGTTLFGPRDYGQAKGQ